MRPAWSLSNIVNLEGIRSSKQFGCLPTFIQVSDKREGENERKHKQHCKEKDGIRSKANGV